MEKLFYRLSQTSFEIHDRVLYCSLTDITIRMRINRRVDWRGTGVSDLDRLFLTRPLPETLILDKGPEFAGTAA